MLKFRKFFFVLFVSLLMSQAHADIIYSNFGPSNTYDTHAGIGIQQSNLWLGLDFNVPTGVDYYLDSVELALTNIDIDRKPSSLNVSIYNANPVPNGSAIETSTIVFNNNQTTITQIDFSGNTILNSGNSYMVALSLVEGTGSMALAYSLADLGLYYSANSGVTWNCNDTTRTPAFSVNGSAVQVPAPAALILGIMGLSAAGIKLRKNR